MSEEAKTETKATKKSTSRSYADAARKNKKGDQQDQTEAAEQSVTETPVSEPAVATESTESKPQTTQRRGRKVKAESNDRQDSPATNDRQDAPVNEAPQGGDMGRQDRDDRPRYDNRNNDRDDRRPRYDNRNNDRNNDRQPDQPYHTDEDLEQMSREELVETVKKQDRIISAMQRRRAQNQMRYNNNGPRNGGRYDPRDRQRGYDRNERFDHNDDRQDRRPRYDRQDPRERNNVERQDRRPANTRPGNRGDDAEYTPDRFRERFPNRHSLNNDRDQQE